MAHETYIRLVSGADTAILFIHGILGTPDHFSFFLPLIPDDISIVNLLLDGHGKGVREFSQTSMKKWESQVNEAVDQLLANHKKVYIVAHSLGTLLAIEQAVKKPVAGLFLLAVPICLAIKPRVIATCWKVYRDNIPASDLYTIAAKNCCSITQHRNLLLYLGWIPRFLELLIKIQKTRKLLPSLTVSVSAYQSLQDELVSTASVSYLTRNRCMDVSALKHSTHYYYAPKDIAFLQEEFIRHFL